MSEDLSAVAEAFARVVRSSMPQTPACYSSSALPPGYRTSAGFARACRQGRVPGAVKRGRAWVVTVESYLRRDAVEVVPRKRSARPSAKAEQRVLANLASRGLTIAEPAVEQANAA
jgi:hypothetical protein